MVRLSCNSNRLNLDKREAKHQKIHDVEQMPSYLFNQTHRQRQLRTFVELNSIDCEGSKDPLANTNHPFHGTISIVFCSFCLD